MSNDSVMEYYLVLACSYMGGDTSPEEGDSHWNPWEYPQQLEPRLFASLPEAFEWGEKVAELEAEKCDVADFADVMICKIFPGRMCELIRHWDGSTENPTWIQPQTLV